MPSAGSRSTAGRCNDEGQPAESRVLTLTCRLVVLPAEWVPGLVSSPAAVATVPGGDGRVPGWQAGLWITGATVERLAVGPKMCRPAFLLVELSDVGIRGRDASRGISGEVGTGAAWPGRRAVFVICGV